VTLARATLANGALFSAGLLFGVSFVATPAKFFADGVSTPDLLRVGRATFGAMMWIELVFCVALVALAVVSARARIVSATVLGIVLLQHFGLRPTLDDRVTEITDSAELAPSGLHHVYAALELLELVGLFTVWWLAGRRRSSP